MLKLCTTRKPYFLVNRRLRAQFKHSGIEEEDHLAWIAKRLEELNSHTSLLNPFWYVGAACGLVAGACGDEVGLGFVVETEKQVEAHLEGHLETIACARSEVTSDCRSNAH